MKRDWGRRSVGPRGCRSRRNAGLRYLCVALAFGTSVPLGIATVGAAFAPAAAAAAPLTCAAGTIYNLTDTGGFYALSTSTGVDTAASPSTLGSGESDPNALGLSPDGSTAYTADQTVKASGTSGTTTVDVENIATGTNTSYTAMPVGGAYYVIAGAVDPVNGYFYYGGWNEAGTEFYLSAFNPSSDTATQAGTITPSGTGTYGSGDIAFDGSGNLYLLAGTTTSTGAIVEVDAAQIATTGTAALTNTSLAILTGLAGTFNGIAFAANSELYAQDGNGDLFEINPDTGAVTKLPAQSGISGGVPDDLASCAYNATLEAETDIVGRAAASDQFTTTITGGGVSAGNTGTTTGTSTGVQTLEAEIAGPIVGLPGTSYSVAETAAANTATSLTDYTTTYSCVNGTTSLLSGSGASFNLNFPAASGNTGAQVVCTFTNTPLATTATTSTTTTTTTTTVPTTTPTTTLSSSSGSTGSTSSLAFTGVGPGTWWMVLSGMGLLLVGVTGRRRWARRPRHGGGS